MSQFALAPSATVGPCRSCVATLDAAAEIRRRLFALAGAVAFAAVLLSGLVGCCRFGSCGTGGCDGGWSTCDAMPCGSFTTTPACAAPACAVPACAAPTYVAPSCSAPQYSAPACAAPAACVTPVTCSAPVFACDDCAPSYDDCIGCGPKVWKRPNWLRRLFGGPCGSHGCGVCCGPSLFGNSAVFGGYDNCDCCGFETAYAPQFYTTSGAMTGTQLGPAAGHPAAVPPSVPMATPVGVPMGVPMGMPMTEPAIVPETVPAMPLPQTTTPFESNVPPIPRSLLPSAPASPTSPLPSTLPPVDATPAGPASELQVPVDLPAATGRYKSYGAPQLNLPTSVDYELPAIRQVVYERHIVRDDLTGATDRRPADQATPRQSSSAASLPVLDLPAGLHAHGKRTSRRQSEAIDAAILP